MASEGNLDRQPAEPADQGESRHRRRPAGSWPAGRVMPCRAAERTKARRRRRRRPGPARWLRLRGARHRAPSPAAATCSSSAQQRGWNYTTSRRATPSTTIPADMRQRRAELDPDLDLRSAGTGARRGATSPSSWQPKPANAAWIGLSEITRVGRRLDPDRARQSHRRLRRASRSSPSCRSTPRCRRCFTSGEKAFYDLRAESHRDPRLDHRQAGRRRGAPRRPRCSSSPTTTASTAGPGRHGFSGSAATGTCSGRTAAHQG